MLRSPRPDSNRTLLADWWELKALASHNGRFSMSKMRSAFGLEADQEPVDFAELDEAFEDALDRASSEIGRRMEWLNGSYPFALARDGRELVFLDQGTPGRHSYLLCLGLSHALEGTLHNAGLLPEIYARQTERNLFQACSSICAGGHLRGPSMSFGWPRADIPKFLEKLKQFTDRFGEGKAVSEMPDGAPTRVKDAGIDIIAWQDTNDFLPGKLFLLGQAASGKNWLSKSVLADASRFVKIWFIPVLASTHICAMFEPFCFEPEYGEKGDWAAGVAAKIGYEVNSFGIIYYRYRIPYYVDLGVTLANDEGIKIEGISKLDDLRDWCLEFRKNLRQMAA